MFKKYAVKKDVEISSLLEEIMKDEIVNIFLNKALLEAAGLGKRFKYNTISNIRN